MMCYKDRTWCTFWTNCKNAPQCEHKLKLSDIDAAREWWGGDNPPICQFKEKPDCYVNN
jgi:hypothetical protein